MAKAKGAGLFWPTVLTVLGLSALLALGTWQLRRLAWKEGLLAQIEARTKAAPIDLAAALRRAAAGEDVEYLRVRVDGRWLHDREQYLWTPEKSGPGWQVFTPLVTPDGTVVIVNRGFIADADRDRTRRAEASDSVTGLTGLLRRPEVPNSFVPANEPARNRWYWRDLDGMSKAMQLAGFGRLVGFFIDSEPLSDQAMKANPALPRGGATRLDLPNSHLQYALTWYGLALTLIGVYVAFAIGRLRQARKDGGSES
ncbi:MAG: SURF1 family protein [Hyphomicrobiaceae bacterium]